MTFVENSLSRTSRNRGWWASTAWSRSAGIRADATRISGDPPEAAALRRPPPEGAETWGGPAFPNATLSIAPPPGFALWNLGFRPFYLLQLHPLLWGLSASILAGIGVSLVTTPPDEELVSKLFDAQPAPVKGLSPENA